MSHKLERARKKMRKKLFAAAASVTLVLSAISSAAFAETADREASLKNATQIKETIAEELQDGKLSDFEKENILNQAADTAVEEFMMIKLNEAVELLEQEKPQLPAGKSYTAYNYDIGDGCELSVELSDFADKDFKQSAPQLASSSDSANIWKEYGNRYFTAKATVTCAGVSVNFILENHYTLSVNGIDERYGTAKATSAVAKTGLDKGEPAVSKSSARNVGASASIYCEFSCKAGTSDADNYKLNTTVKYLAHDKTGKRLQVQQAWNLTKK